jgi:hypothetical protein
MLEVKRRVKQIYETRDEHMMKRPAKRARKK